MGNLEQGKIIEGESFLFLYSGDLVRFVPEDVRRLCAIRVSEELSMHAHTMLQFSPDQILESMQNGTSVLVVNKDIQLAGFAQLWQYGFNQNGQQILEFGSWLNVSSTKRLGGKILKEAISLGKRIDPTAQIVAIVEQDNAQAQNVLVNYGAREIGTKFSPYIRTVEGEAAFMKIYDLTT